MLFDPKHDPTVAPRLQEEIDYAGSRLRELQAEPLPTHQPITHDDRSKNPMRPSNFSEVIGQVKAVEIMRRMVDAAKRRQRLDHVLMTGPAGTGKTTFANVIANELGVDCYQISAPVSLDTLLELRVTLDDADVLFIDEIHQQAILERRGKESSTQPEIFLQLLEDFVLATSTGMLPFPRITVIGATTDPGRLPDAFLDRFPIQPRLEPYDRTDLGMMALWNAEKLGLTITIEAADAFAKASRATPRLINRYMQNAAALTTDDVVTLELAHEVLYDLNDVQPDGLSRDQVNMLVFMYRHGRRETKEGDVRYQASVSSIATAIGLSRDQKAVQLRVEPGLITSGLIGVEHGGRRLTDAGIARAEALIADSA